MKKSKYIGKYDFINYFTKQPALWFFSNQEIQATIKTQIKEIEIETEEDNDGEYDFDSYEYYKEIKEELGDVDKDDPKIIEGIIIDEKSRTFICSKFKHIEKIYDLENGDYKFKKQEEIAEITKKLILDNENIILFQPVFISNELITKPDAIVKQGHEILLIETKNTSTAKRHHFLDIFFQSKVLNGIDYLEDFYFDYNLCLIKYCYANKKEVPFDLTPSFNIVRSPTTKSEDLNIKYLIKKGMGIEKKTKDSIDFVECPIIIKNLCEQNYTDLETRMELSIKKQTVEEAKKQIVNVDVKFDSIIKELIDHKNKMLEKEIDMIDEINPHPNEKSYWKLSNLFPELKQLFLMKGYNLFKYSGNIVKQDQQSLSTIKKSDDLQKYFKNDEKYRMFMLSNDEVLVNEGSINLLISNLKDKKVYFDFETLNSSIRVIDNSLPFMQIITQCSIIVDHNDGTDGKDLKCNNILLDPKEITINDFKNIVDSLYMGNDFSYIVYNKSFERSRLKELKKFINENEYSEMIDCIINNLHDLADYFNVNNKKISPPIVIRELGGYYSIKKVLPFICKTRNDLYQKSGSIDYHDIEKIQNGLICQTETTKRFYDIIDDKGWEKLSINLKKYCENDVRAMIAVEYYIKSLIV